MKGLLRLVASILILAVSTAPAYAHEAGTWVLRAGVGTVAPDSKNLVIPEVGTVEVDDSASLTLTATYMFTPNWALDILAAWPFSHDIDLRNGAGSSKIASTDHLPPTVSVQYHFSPAAKFQPYVGLGLNYTTFFSTDTIKALSNNGTELDLDDSFGLALQLGADIAIGDGPWLANIDVRKIKIDSDAKLGGGAIGNVKIDPWVYSVSFGYSF